MPAIDHKPVRLRPIEIAAELARREDDTGLCQRGASTILFLMNELTAKNGGKAIDQIVKEAIDTSNQQSV